MKIFLSWSGIRSRAVAEALNDWLPRVIQAVRPFFSPEIEKGANWSNEIDRALEGTRFGIVCLTSDNLTSEWIHYETGALSKTPDALVWTFLLDVDKGDVKPPLGKFQHTAAQLDDVRELVRTINRRLKDAGGTPLGDRMLEETFDDLWPRLQTQLEAARAIAVPDARVAAPRRDIHEMMEEALELLRQQQRGGVNAAGNFVISRSYSGSGGSGVAGIPGGAIPVTRFSVTPVPVGFRDNLVSRLGKFNMGGSITVHSHGDGTFKLVAVLSSPVDPYVIQLFVRDVAEATGMLRFPNLFFPEIAPTKDPFGEMTSDSELSGT